MAQCTQGCGFLFSARVCLGNGLGSVLSEKAEMVEIIKVIL